MTMTIENIPTWSMCYLFNGDDEGLTKDEIQEIDKWCKDVKLVGLSLREEEDGFADPHFSMYPAFGRPTDVYSCDVLCES